MIIRDIMNPTVISVSVGATYNEVARLLHDKGLAGVPVLDSDGVLVGVISEKDLFRVLYPYYDSYYTNPEDYTDFKHRDEKILELKDNPVTKFMSKDVITTTPDAYAMKVGGIMLAKGIHCIPVIEDGGLVGIVNRMDIYRNILKFHLDF
ncbi:MAG: acetoin utilization protein AcuB [Planctomycetota bacterium]|jgi:acetoin utilization protein AcuB